MTLKRVILGILTAIAIALVGLSLLASWNQPQIQSRLELYQTNLLLHASEWQGENNQSANLSSARNNIVGTDPLNTALTQYQEARDSTRKTLETTQSQFKGIQSAIASKSADNTLSLPQNKALSESIDRQSVLLNELDLRLGILQVSIGKTEAALQTWKNLVERYKTKIDDDSLVVTAQVLTGIWSNPAQLLPDAEPRIQKSLDGWFRYRALAQLYKLQEHSKELAALQAAEQVTAQQAVEKLAIIVGVPAIALCIGTVLLVGLTVQWLLQRKQLDTAGSGPVLARNASLTWAVPWDGEIVWQVLVVGFFFVGQILIPYLLLPVSLAVLKLNPLLLTRAARLFISLLLICCCRLGGFRYCIFRSSLFCLCLKVGFGLIGGEVGFCGVLAAILLLCLW